MCTLILTHALIHMGTVAELCVRNEERARQRHRRRGREVEKEKKGDLLKQLQSLFFNPTHGRISQHWRSSTWRRGLSSARERTKTTLTQE